MVVDDLAGKGRNGTEVFSLVTDPQFYEATYARALAGLTQNACNLVPLETRKLGIAAVGYRLNRSGLHKTKTLALPADIAHTL